MMTKRQTTDLNRINRAIPEHLQRRLVQEEVDDTQAGMAREIIKKKLVSPDKAKKLQEALDRGDLTHRKRTVNKAAESQMDDFLTKRIRHEIASGRLPKAKHDAFTRKIQRRMSGKV